MDYVDHCPIALRFSHFYQFIYESNLPSILIFLKYTVQRLYSILHQSKQLNSSYEKNYKNLITDVVKKEGVNTRNQCLQECYCCYQEGCQKHYQGTGRRFSHYYSNRKLLQVAEPPSVIKLSDRNIRRFHKLNNH